MKYFQAIPLYLPSDVQTAEYFTKFQEEASAVTGALIAVLLPTPVQLGKASALSELFTSDPTDSGKRRRYPNLTWADLPCLWLEDGNGGTAIISLDVKVVEVSRLIRLLADAARHCESAPQVREWIAARLKKDASTMPWLQVLMETQMQPSTERLIAVISGIVFVSMMLVIALFVPQPSLFQETVFRIVLSLASAGFVSMTPGLLNVKIGGFLQAGGALAVFVIVFFYNPVSLVAPTH
jgi:hypothetical protein